MAGARAAQGRREYAESLKQLEEALGLKPNEAGALKLKAEVEQQQAAITKPRGMTITNGLGMEFVWIAVLPGGGAYVGKCEVTQEQFRKLMGKLPGLQSAPGANLPVASVAFKDAQEFCNLLSRQEHKAYALPSREEWLAAAGLGEDQVALAWNLVRDRGMLQREVTSLTKSLQGPEAIGGRGAQTNGLYDLFGNVREWVIGKTTEERAGFSYQSPGGRRSNLFLPGNANDPWIQLETGFRCVLRE
jgi:formylglycine-generating enzyme required for sulfatase activity